MMDCRLCVYWTGKDYCEQDFFIIDPLYAVNCKCYCESSDYKMFLEALDEIHRKVEDGDYSDFSRLKKGDVE